MQLRNNHPRPFLHQNKYKNTFKSVYETTDSFTHILSSVYQHWSKLGKTKSFNITWKGITISKFGSPVKSVYGLLYKQTKA